MVPQKTWVLDNFGKIWKLESVFDKLQVSLLHDLFLPLFVITELFTKESQTRIFN